MVIDNKFEIGDIVYLSTDEEQLMRLVTSINISNNDLLYQLSCGSNNSNHYDFEISKKKSFQL